MTYYADTITYAGQAINVRSLSPERIQAPYIQKTGRTLSIVSVPTDTMAWRIVINGVIIGSETTLTTARTLLQDADDDKLPHTLTDGVHNGDYISEELKWVDDGSTASMKTHISFTLTLIEKKFSGGY